MPYVEVSGSCSTQQGLKQAFDDQRAVQTPLQKETTGSLQSQGQFPEIVQSRVGVEELGNPLRLSVSRGVDQALGHEGALRGRTPQALERHHLDVAGAFGRSLLRHHHRAPGKASKLDEQRGPLVLGQRLDVVQEP